jgi:glycosyltransferase involved in cell wall biosynthesis
MSGITVIMNTCNEASRVRSCLERVTWADDIVITDMESTDETVAICREFTDRIFPHPRLPSNEVTRDICIKLAECEWILVLDPDELVTTSLKDTLIKIASDPNSADGYMIPFVTMMFGREIKHSGWDRDEHLRFFRKDKSHWPVEVHAGVVVDGTVERLSKEQGYVLHDNYQSITQFIEKMNRYTIHEAELLKSKGRPFHPLKLFYQPGKEFYNRYIKMGGYRGGVLGLMLALLQAFYVQLTYIKLWELLDREEGTGKREE